MTSPQLRPYPDDLPNDNAVDASSAPFELKQQVAERLASHRARRSRPALDEQAEQTAPHPARTRSARVAAAVAERYAQTPSYRAFLASEAEQSVQQAQAAAEIATINAQAIAMAQQRLLADLEQWNWSSDAGERSVAPGAAEAAASVVSHMVQQSAARAAAIARDAAAPLVQERAAGGFTVRLYENVGRVTPAEARRESGLASPVEANDSEREAMEDEIAFRHDPYFEERTAPEPIAANLIEFPRHLVAARKARPRRAEGPLLDDPNTAEGVSQLRIFEVQADQMSTAPANESVTPEWTSIMLAALPSTETEPAAWGDLSPTLVPQTAPLARRAMSGLVDAAIIGAGTAVFAATAVQTMIVLNQGAVTRLTLPAAGAALAITFAVLATVYLLLSFSVGDATVGMRYARIGLCTFSDENPTRRSMRRRLLAMFLSVAPVGLGFLWACLDEDRLGWHDRMSRMYQRAY